MRDGQDGGGRPSSRHILAFLAGVSAVILVQVSADPPTTGWGWMLLLVGAVLGVVAGAAALDGILSLAAWSLTAAGERLPVSARPARRWLAGHRRAVLLVFLVAALSLGLGWLLVPRVADFRAALRVRLSGCGHATEVRVLATVDGLASARHLADEYERHTARRNHGCPTADLYAYPMSMVTTREVRTSGWSAGHLTTILPRPDIVLPDSTLYGFPEPSPAHGLAAVDRSGVASSPIVLAVPAPAAASAVEYRTGRTWADLFDRAQQLGWSVARTDPDVSLVGELATVMLYHVPGTTDPWRLVDATQARAIEQRLAVAGGFAGDPLGDAADLLCRHRQRGSVPTAVIVSEQSMVRFNAGLALGGACATDANPAPPDQRLIGFYPRDSFGLDVPLIHLTWSDTSAAQAEAVRGFRGWLESVEGKRALVAVGLRPQRFALGDPVSEQFGVLAAARSATEPPEDSVVAGVRASHTQAKLPARVLLALDASGSMRVEVGRGGPARFAVAVDGVVKSLEHMGGRDEFGLSVFPGRASTVDVLVPIGPGDDRRRQEVTSALTATRPTGLTTPLFRAVVDGVEAVRAGGGAPIRAVVVLTDGEDTARDLTGGELVSTVRGKGVRVLVVAVGGATCRAGGLGDAVRETGGACHETSFDNLGEHLDQLFAVLFGGGDVGGDGG